MRKLVKSGKADAAYRTVLDEKPDGFYAYLAERRAGRPRKRAG